MTTDTTAPSKGWPDPARPGYPMNPEKDGAHIINGTLMLWNAQWRRFVTSDGSFLWPDDVDHNPYEGPCLTPAQADAAVQAEREACAKVAEAMCQGRIFPVHVPTSARKYRGDVADSIRARGTTDALAQQIAKPIGTLRTLADGTCEFRRIGEANSPTSQSYTWQYVYGQPSQQIAEAEMPGDVTEEIAQMLWHRFAPGHHITWEDESEKAIYRDAANDVTKRIRALPSQEPQQ